MAEVMVSIEIMNPFTVNWGSRVAKRSKISNKIAENAGYSNLSSFVSRGECVNFVPLEMDEIVQMQDSMHSIFKIQISEHIPIKLLS